MLGRESEGWLAVGDLVEDAVEVVAGEDPLERSGDLAVVVAEGQQPLGELIERAEAVGRERLALDDREVELDLVEPGGVDRQVDEVRVRPAVPDAPNRSLAGVR